MLELSAAGLLGLRKGKDFLLVVLVNVLTNPLLGLILDGIYLGIGTLPGWYILVPLEAAVVIAEGTLYRGRLAYDKMNPYLFSLLLNGTSCLGGLMIT